MQNEMYLHRQIIYKSGDETGDVVFITDENQNFCEPPWGRWIFPRVVLWGKLGS